MHFGSTLERSIYPPWRDNYIDYAVLKKLLRDSSDSAPASPSAAVSAADSAAPWTDDDESAFVNELVNVQLEKVHAFHQATHEKLRDRTAKCEARLDAIATAEDGTDAAGPDDEAAETTATTAGSGGMGLLKGSGTERVSGGGNGDGNGNGKKAVPSDEDKQKTLQDVLSELDHITRETNELEKYSRLNYTGFLKAAKKHDRKRGASYRVRPLLQVRLAALPFNKEDYSPLLYRLSAMYSFVRQRLDSGDARDVGRTEPRPGQDEYVSQKFWVHPENLLEVKTMILRRLPVLVYNPQTSKVAEGHRPDPSITSIYFDDPTFRLYTRKVDHGEASSLRLRWYGQLNNGPEIWAEKKTITEDETSHESRFNTKEKYVQRFIKGEYHMEKQIRKVEARAGPDSVEAEDLASAVKEIQRFIEEYGLQPVVRANYTRTAFQIPGDDRVRISLDTDLAFIREDALDADRPCRDPDNWHRDDIDDPELQYPFSAIRKGEISRFPFALLEIKMRSATAQSEWIQDLMHSHLVKAAPRFSKFVHGVAQLFEDHVNTFPFWLSEMEADIRRDPLQAFEEEQAEKRRAMDDAFAVGSLIKSRTSVASPRLRASPHGVLSPVGSPSVRGMTGAQKPSDRGATVSTSVAAEASQLADTAEEPDEDETGEQAHVAPRDSSTTTNLRSGLQNLFPSFSTSKYAQARRSRGGHGPLPPGVREPRHWIKDQGPVRVEAKVWLANQRTFIKWQHVSVLLASLSLGLYNAAGADNTVARALAVVYTVIAVLAGAWGYGVYMWRTRLIERRSGKDFDAVAGPVCVCVALLVALVLNFGLKYRVAMQERERGHGDGVGMGNRTEYLLR